MHRVAVLALDGVVPFELSLAARIFGTAEGLYEVITCSLDGAPVATGADYSVVVAHDASVLAEADTVVVPGSEAHAAFTGPHALPEPLAIALGTIRPGSRLVTICIATYVLAAAGLLDGRPATTHWRHAAHFRRHYPRVRLDPGVLFVDDGDVLTSAGAAAGLDLCLHMLRRDHGSDLANQVARRCVVPPWRDGGQAQYVERPLPTSSDASVAATREWAMRHLGEPLSLVTLADHARMSLRTFTRRFRAETGTSPGRWLLQQRLDLARTLLEAGDLPVDRVATRSGFGTAASLRRHFAAGIGVSPVAYRRTFRREAAVAVSTECFSGNPEPG
ncbi:helix-turn-helix domain-containing protein [Streptosporangium sp. NPDC048047]|uniref:GlxA family transcriptional regulator n=1 Tax=Streptosporangium sp. NPDC048047 TaxID=3155748 RepID=UPI0034478F98